MSCQQTTFPAGSCGDECLVPRRGVLGDGHCIHYTNPDVTLSETSLPRHPLSMDV